jgi:hypothetical protein
VARALMDRGFSLVRPLAGGLDGWERAGFPLEPDPLVALREAGSDAKGRGTSLPVSGANP